MATAATPERSFDVTCREHAYPLRTDGSCPRCEAEAERRARGLAVFAPVPDHHTWPRPVKLWLFAQWQQHVASTHGDAATREQEAWEKMLRAVGQATALTHRRLAVTPAEVWHLLRAQRPDLWLAPAGTPTPETAHAASAEEASASGDAVAR